MGARASDPSEKGEKAADAGGQQTFLYKEEFKLIMQLIFTLSEYDLKNASAQKSNVQEQVASEEEGETSEIYQWLEQNRENRRERFKLVPVKIQSCE